jgi:hypothetical protein
VGEERISLEGVAVVIAEGTYTSLLRHVDTRVFIARTRRDTLEHRMKRNRGGEARDPFVEQVLTWEHVIIAGHRHLADLFITLDKLWPDGKPSQEDLSKIFLRRPFPFSRFTIEDTGEEEAVWTTFGKQEPSDQIDMDRRSEAYRKPLTDFMAGFSRNGVSMVRLDAIGYVVKKIGTMGIGSMTSSFPT